MDLPIASVMTLFVGLGLGALITTFVLRTKHLAELTPLQERSEKLPSLEAALAESQNHSRQLEKELLEIKIRLDLEGKEAAKQLEFLKNARDELALQFKNLAQEILEEKSRKATELHQNELQTLLDPLKTRLHEFKSKMEELHEKELIQHTELRSELTRLKDSNLKITEEAHELATALKGNKKMQGNWGELLLENVLERSGLRKGIDYRREVSFNTEEGRRRPDVIVDLPDQKHLIIDAKVSLNAYTRYVNAEDETERQLALEAHVQAIEERIRELSNRQYFDLPGLHSPEVVFMFIPIESAFVEALKARETLFQSALSMNVLMATPTTLLTSLNIVRQLWRFEEHNAHMSELADRASKIYKKLVTFIGSLEDVGNALNSAKASFDTAWGQLYSGRGNLIAQASQFERLGVAITKALPEELVQKAELELDHDPG